jgi:hypothetical protein
MFWLYDDSGRFVKTPAGWEQQAGGTILPDLAPIRTVMSQVAPERVLSDAESVVIGTVARRGVEYKTNSEGVQYALVNYELSDVEVLKGAAENEITLHAIASGNYWPSWRDDPTYPRWVEEGKRYCFFVRRTDEGLVVVRGMSGAYEIRGDQLLLPGRRAIGFGLKDIRKRGEEQ